jgi:hypothetical protein
MSYKAEDDEVKSTMTLYEDMEVKLASEQN